MIIMIITAKLTLTSAVEFKSRLRLKLMFVRLREAGRRNSESTGWSICAKYFLALKIKNQGKSRTSKIPVTKLRLRVEKLRISRLKHLHNLALKIRASFTLFNFKRVYNILATITPLTKDFTSNYLTKRLYVWNTPYVILSWSFQQSTKWVHGQWRSIIRI